MVLAGFVPYSSLINFHLNSYGILESWALGFLAGFDPFMLLVQLTEINTELLKSWIPEFGAGFGLTRNQVCLAASNSRFRKAFFCLKPRPLYLIAFQCHNPLNHVHLTQIM